MEQEGGLVHLHLIACIARFRSPERACAHCFELMATCVCAWLLTRKLVKQAEQSNKDGKVGLCTGLRVMCILPVFFPALFSNLILS